MPVVIAAIILSLLAIALVVVGVLAWTRGKRKHRAGYFPQRILAGQEAAAAGKTARAGKIFQEILKQAPQSKGPPAEIQTAVGSARLGLGDLAQAAGQKAAALDHYLKAAGTIQLPGPALAFTARELIQKNQFDPPALVIYAAYLRLWPNPAGSDPVVSRLVAFCQDAYAPETPKEGLAAIAAAAETLLDAAPGLDWACLARGVALGRLGEPRAIQVLAQAEQLNPANGTAAYYTGYFQREQGDLGPALQSFRRSLATAPGQPAALLLAAKTAYTLARAPGGSPKLLEEAGRWAETACSLQPALAENWFTAGQIRHLQGQRSAARTAYTRAAAADPANYLYPLSLARLLAEMGETQPALDAFQKSIRLNPQCYPAHAQSARLYYATQRYPEAERYYRQSLALNPKSDEALEGLAFSLYMQQKYAEALPHLEKIRQPSAAALTYLGRSYSQGRDAARAIQAYNRFLKEHGENGEVLHSLGLALAHQGQPQAAVQALERADRLAEAAGQPDGTIRYHYGTALQQAGEHDKARPVLESAARLAPGQAQIAYACGAAAFQAQDWDAAAGWFQAALKDPSQQAGAQFGLGAAREKQGEFKAAEAAYTAGLQLAPQAYRAWARLGIVQARLGEYALALQNLEASGRGPERATAEMTFWKAYALAQLGDFPAARLLFDDLAQRAPQDPALSQNRLFTLFKLGQAAANRGDYPAAVEAWESAARIAPESAGLRDCLAEAYLRSAAVTLAYGPSEQWDLAGQRLEAALRLQPDDLRAQFARVLVALAHGDWAAARPWLDCLAEEEPDRPELPFYQALAQMWQNEPDQVEKTLDGWQPAEASLAVRRSLLIANLALSRQSWDEALEEYSRLLCLSPAPAGEAV